MLYAPKKMYLGDSVYVEADDDCTSPAFTLTVEEAGGTSNRIVIDPDVWDSLCEWVKARFPAPQDSVEE